MGSNFARTGYLDGVQAMTILEHAARIESHELRLGQHEAMNTIELRNAFPKLYPTDLPDHMVDIPAGWSDIARKLSERIKDEPIRVLQIKEKSGGLRFYFSGAVSSNVEAAIMEAEDASWVTCDVCGLPGVLRENERGWLRVRCDEHGDGALRVDSNRRDNLPVTVNGLHAPRRNGVARGFVTPDEWNPDHLG